MDFEVIDLQVEKLSNFRESYSIEFMASILDALDHLMNYHGYVPSQENIEFLTEMNLTACQAILLEEQYRKPAYAYGEK